MAGEMIIQYLEQTMIQQYKTDIGFRTLVESVDDNMYIIPKYQRKYRWSRQQVNGLVESLLRGLPIPPIYTCRNRDNQLEILDGQQRVMSLFFYYIGYFLNKKESSSINFSDMEVENESFKSALMKHYPMEKLSVFMESSDNKKINADYAALPVEIKRRVDYTTITVIEIKIGQEEKKDEVLQRIFANLNTGGSLLSPQELRNGIYMCEFYDMLQNFNRKNATWRKLWGREDPKEKDMETLLRFCALKKYVQVINDGNGCFSFEIDGYNSSYTDMLNRFSGEVLKFQKEEIISYLDDLGEFVELFEINTVLSSKVALVEGFYVIFEKMGLHKKITKKIMNAVSEENKYKENSGQHTVNIKKMNGRWHAVYDVWSKSSQ